MNKLTNIYLIRHSKTLKINYKGIDKNDTNMTQFNNENLTLSDEGNKLAYKLSFVSELKNIDVIYSSEYVRCIQTAKYIAYNNDLNINIDKNFNERKLGNILQLEILGKDKKFPYTIEQLKDDILKNIDGESKKDVLNRFEKSLNLILKKDNKKNIVIVSHGAAIKFLLSKWCKLNEDNNLEYKDKEIFVDSPCIIHLTYNMNKLINLESINY